jgi:MFS family permease
VICAATALARSFAQLTFFRAAEGLGESFYFPASMSILGDYHGPRTRSRAMSVHQTSVYLGTAGGAVLAGHLGERYGWRAPFWALGLAGAIYAGLLAVCLVEPLRSRTKPGNGGPAPGRDLERNSPAVSGESLVGKIARIASNPPAALLLLVFVGANFVAATFLTWLPFYIFEGFAQGLSDASVTSIYWPLASLPGAVCGGVVADWAARRSRGGRIRVQGLGLILGAPFVFLTGWSTSVSMLIPALIGAGLCKGVYDANIFAAFFDVVPPEDRGTAAGLMNTVGWTGGVAAPTVIGAASRHLGLGVAITSTAGVYLVAGLVALLAARLAEADRFGVN